METAAVTSGTSDVLQVVSDDLGRVGIKVDVNVMPFATRRSFSRRTAGRAT